MKLLIFSTALCLFNVKARAQQPQDSLNAKKNNSFVKPANKILISTYVRVITDANGKMRIDENLVANIPINSWLNLELGARKGERPQHVDSYYHYKVDLHTKVFLKRVKFVVRMSDNVNQYPTPTYRKSNYLAFAESRWPLTSSLLLMVAGGHVLSYQENNTMAELPTTSGTKTNFFIYKIGLKYAHRDKITLEATYGTFDVFNPYLLQNPFVQLSGEVELSSRYSAFTYYRYQYNNRFSVAYNNYAGIGLRMRLP